MDQKKKLFALAFILEEEQQKQKIRTARRRYFWLKTKQRRIEFLNLMYQEYMSKITAIGLAYSNRSIWMKKRSNTWWNDIVLNNIEFSDTDWIANFRVDRQTFFEICTIVDDDLKPKPAFLQSRQPIPTYKQVAIALYKLASSGEMRIVANNMGVSIPTVHKCVRRFVNAMLKHVNKFIYIPTADEAPEIAQKFQKMSSIPQILMVIDGTHIPITAPTEGYGDFKNRKGWTSFNVQVVADADYIFRDVSCQYPGATHDAYVFKNSGLFENAKNCIPTNPQVINGDIIDYYMIGDPAYPLLDWLIKCYSGTLSPQQESFNAYLNSARIVIENSIGKLKSRWRILKKTVEMDYKFVPKIIVVCCMLHNILQKKKIPMPQDTQEDAENIYDQPEKQKIVNSNSASECNGLQLREKLRKITNKLPLRKQIRIKPK